MKKIHCTSLKCHAKHKKSMFNHITRSILTAYANNLFFSYFIPNRIITENLIKKLQVIASGGTIENGHAKHIFLVKIMTEAWFSSQPYINLSAYIYTNIF